MIFYQSKYKRVIKNKVTIKYERLIDSLDSNLSKLESTFGITATPARAHKCLEKPTSSRNLRYWYNEIYNTKAIVLTKLACRYWGYNLK